MKKRESWEKRLAESGNGNFYIDDQNVTKEEFEREKEIQERLKQARREGMEEAIKEIKKGIEWNTGRVMYKNPKDNKKYLVYNANHIKEIISTLKKKEGIKWEKLKLFKVGIIKNKW